MGIVKSMVCSCVSILLFLLYFTCSLNLEGTKDKGEISDGTKAATGFYISSGKLYDANGNQFIMRGISHAHVWYMSQLTNAITGIKSVGANCVRIVLGCGVQWGPNSASDVANVIALCKANRLIVIPEVHDTTGYGEASAACSLATAVNYWKSIKSALDGQEKYVIINIGNEPYGNNNVSAWVTDTINAIKAMRDAGFQHTLMVDAPNWGQDWSFTMLNNAQAIFDADTLKNTILSVHMYGVYDTAAEVLNYITNFVGKSLPLVIGEFGYKHSDGDPDEASIMSYAQQYGIGYIGWSWCGNGGGVEYLDMVNNWNVNSLTEWGQIIINGANGIKATAKECTIFSGASSSSASVSSASSRVSSVSSIAVSSSVSSVSSSRSSTVSSVASSTTSAQYQDISLPFSFDGAGEKWWKTSGTINYINSWNLDALEINGVSIKNQWVSGSSLPAKQDGYYYIHYKGSVGWAHVEINGTSGTSSSVSSAVTSSRSSTASSAVSSTSSSRSSAISSAASSASSVQYTEVTAPFTFDGAGEKYWKISNIPAYINSWNLDALTINDVDIKNKYVATSGLPAKKSDGYYYIYYKGSYAWSHVEIK